MTPKEILHDMFQGQTLVFGHRGAKAYAPMNTLPAFELAVVQGARGIELDVHRSKDGYPVILHDFTVDGTTDGSGKVTGMTLAELKELDAGGWFSEKFQGVRIPTLDEVFDLVGRKVYVNVEIKSEAYESDGVEQIVSDCIVRHVMQHRVIVSSFNPLTLKRFRNILPDVPIGYLYMPAYEPPGFNTPAAIKQSECEAQHPYHEIIDEAYMQWAREQHYIVGAWTVNDPLRARVLRDLGVNALITDMPDIILDALHG